MGNTSTKLPSPNSRRKPDRSNMPPYTNVQVAIAPDSGKAHCTLTQNVVINGVPGCVLTGSGHAGPLFPITIEQINLVEFLLTFAEAVEEGDKIQWPERDPAIRSRIGGYIEPLSYAVGAAPVLGPYVIGIEYRGSDGRLLVTFNVDVEQTVGSPAGLITFKTPDGVTLVIDEVDAISGPEVAFTTVWQPNLLMTGTASSVGLGTALQESGGGAPVQDFTAFAVTQDVATAAPMLVHATWNAATKVSQLYWNMNVLENAVKDNVIQDDGTRRWSNLASGSNITPTIMSYNCPADFGESADADTVAIDEDTVIGDESGLGNANVTGFATVPA